MRAGCLSLVLGCMLVLSGAVRGDALKLAAGGEVRGTVERLVITSDGKTVALNRDAVMSVTFRSAGEDQVLLRDGTTMSGRVVSVRMRWPGGVRTFGREEMGALSMAVDPLAEATRRIYETKRSKLDLGDAAAVMGLAEWCQGNGLKREAGELAEAALGAKPDEATAEKAHLLLGHVRWGGEWVSGAEAAKREAAVKKAAADAGKTDAGGAVKSDAAAKEGADKAAAAAAKQGGEGADKAAAGEAKAAVEPMPDAANPGGSDSAKAGTALSAAELEKVTEAVPDDVAEKLSPEQRKVLGEALTRNKRLYTAYMARSAAAMKQQVDGVQGRYRESWVRASRKVSQLTAVVERKKKERERAVAAIEAQAKADMRPGMVPGPRPNREVNLANDGLDADIANLTAAQAEKSQLLMTVRGEVAPIQAEDQGRRERFAAVYSRIRQALLTGKVVDAEAMKESYEGAVRRK